MPMGLSGGRCTGQKVRQSLWLTVKGGTHFLEEGRRAGCKGSSNSSLTRGEFV